MQELAITEEMLFPSHMHFALSCHLAADVWWSGLLKLITGCILQGFMRAPDSTNGFQDRVSGADELRCLGRMLGESFLALHPSHVVSIVRSAVGHTSECRLSCLLLCDKQLQLEARKTSSTRQPELHGGLGFVGLSTSVFQARIGSD